VTGPEIDRRSAIAWLALAPALVAGCDERPDPQKPPVPPTTPDMPEDGSYRWDFGGELLG
jgi:hypothetical protein